MLRAEHTHKDLLVLCSRPVFQTALTTAPGSRTRSHGSIPALLLPSSVTLSMPPAVLPMSREVQSPEAPSTAWTSQTGHCPTTGLEQYGFHSWHDLKKKRKKSRVIIPSMIRSPEESFGLICPNLQDPVAGVLLFWQLSSAL